VTAAAAAAEAGKEAGAEGESNMQQLYGLWQTEEFIRRAVDGKVPRNERGNVEVPPLAKSMPLGEHLCYMLSSSRDDQGIIGCRGCPQTAVMS
jgi:hypothetical protein